MKIVKIIETLQSYAENVVAYKLDSAFAHAVSDAVSMLVWQGQRIAELEKQNRWIPVSEQPKEKGWYWVYAPSYYGGSSGALCNINGIMFAKWNGKNWSIEVGYYKRPGCVTYWMPLPEPPKEDA